MKRVLTAVVLIPLVLLVLFKAPLWLFTLVVGVVAMGAVWEYLKLVDGYGIQSMKMPVLVATVAFFVALATTPWAISFVAVEIASFFLFPLLLLALAMRTD